MAHPPNPMAQAFAGAFANQSLGLVFWTINEKIKIWKAVKEDCNELQSNLDQIVACMDDEIANWRNVPITAIARQNRDQVRNLARDMEDCIERFLYPVITCQDGASLLRRGFHSVQTILARDAFAKKMKKLNKRLQKAGERMKITLPGAGQLANSSAALARRGRSDTPNPVGIAKAKKDLINLLDELEGESQKLRVISVVGFGGSGKTTLVRAVYDDINAADRDDRPFPLLAWVHGSDYEDADGPLKKIIKELWGETGEAATKDMDEHRVRDYIRNKLKTHRYLIVLDDMTTDIWLWINSIFINNGKSSRIIVIASTMSVANHCNPGDGYVYQVRTIGDKGSMKISLLDKEVTNDDNSNTLLNKCNGHPLALDSVASHFKSTGDHTMDQSKKVLCKELGLFLNFAQSGESFESLRDVVMDNYAGLSDRTVRTCLLYLGMFPDGRHIKKNKITRRWVAEGYAQVDNGSPSEHQEVADANFKKLIDRNIIKPDSVSGSKNSNKVLKTWRTLGIVHEFVLSKSMYENFIMVFPCPQKQPKSSTGNNTTRKVRHIFVNDNNVRSSGNLDLSCARSLTISGMAAEAFSNFGRYKLMRVLDLEECTDVKPIHLQDICKLWNLRYLSLGRNITKLPEQIAQLKLLESLHLSKEVVSELPVEVIGMSRLVHLSGKFKILYEKERDAIALSAKSNLETIAGAVVDGEQGFLLLMPHMEKLRKVKLWCTSNNRNQDRNIKRLDTQLLQALRTYTQNVKNRSLSIDFKGLTQDDLEKVQNKASYDKNYMFFEKRLKNIYLSSLKLCGILSTIPQFVADLADLTKLCLSLTTLTQHHLSSLSPINSLVHLKLIADEIAGNLVIEVREFQTLQSLCLQVSGYSAAKLNIKVKKECSSETNKRKEIIFALPNLVSLQLLCEHLDGPSDIDISRLKKLKEIELHHEVKGNAREEWELAAGKHPNRPNVLPLVSVDDPEDPSAGAATEESGNGHAGPQEQLANNEDSPTAARSIKYALSRLTSLFRARNPLVLDPPSSQSKLVAHMPGVRRQPV